jgi:putative transposase
MKRTWSIEEKIAIIKEVENQGVVETCRKHGIYASTYYDWKKKYTMGGAEALRPGYSRREQQDIRKLQKENERLKKLLAEKELEVQLKTELLKKKMAQWNNAKR